MHSIYMSKSVGIVGASGLIGTELARVYQELGWRVLRISRRPKHILNEEWAVIEKESLAGLDVLINLAGEPIDKRWTDANKRRFHTSRIGLSQQLGRWLNELPDDQRPPAWINASAVGIYGDCADTVLTEQSPAGSNYLAQLCKDWEAAAHETPLTNCRIIQPRIGVVIGKKAHAWEKMNTPFSLGLGGKLGNGKQWFPWIHLKDVVDSLIFLSEHPGAEGPYNLAAPESVRNAVFTKALGSALHRPTFFSVPGFALRFLLGEFSSALLASQQVSPQNLEKSGYQWSFPTLSKALEDLV